MYSDMVGTLNGVLVGINRKDEKSWKVLYNTCYVPFCVYVESLVGDMEGAKDIVQDVLVGVWCANLCFLTSEELLGYLYKALYHRSVSDIRNRKRRKEILDTMIKQETEAEHLGDNEFLLGAVREEIMRLLYICVKDLPPMRREILEMSIKGLSNKEIADTLGIALNTVKVQKNRSLRCLREKMVNVRAEFEECS